MTVCCLNPALHLYGDWILLPLKTRVDYKLLRSFVSGGQFLTQDHTMLTYRY